MFASLHCLQTESGAHLALYSVDARALYPGIKPQHEADQSPQSSAEVKSAWGFVSSPQDAFMVWCFIKNRESFVFTFYLLCSVYLMKQGKIIYIPEKCCTFVV